MESRGNILIIDDDEDFGRSLRRLLRLDGFARIDACTSYQQATSNGRLGSYDVILLDRKLPEGTAEQILPELKKIAPDPAVIILTGYANLESTIKVFREGAADFLTKPVSREVLRSTVERNITLKQSRDGLRNYVKVLDHVHDAVISMTSDGTINTWNPAAERIYGYAADEVIGQSIELFSFPEDELRFTERIVPALTESGHYDVDLRARHKCGAEVYVAFRLTEQRDDAGNLQCIIACSNDITEQRRLQVQLLQISENEKRRIGQDLHDDLCQQLGGIACITKVVQNALVGSDPDSAKILGDIVGMVNDANTRARSIARGFMPVTLESGGLIQALHELATTTEKLFGVTCTVESEVDVDLTANGGVQVFRIVQEAIGNAVKHGKADAITIDVKRVAGNYVFEIGDNGRGIPSEASDTGGMGLVTMSLRAEVLGGHLAIAENDSEGTKVVCTIPISPDR
ncbi:MAG: two-component system sensor kinase FixL [Verrucomicrobiales bacterium]|jgi:two-component system sensor kinase FixL